MDINLTAPFLLSLALARETPEDSNARIVNIFDWRALRPGIDHFPYTVSKSALAAMNRSLAISLAPRITVNGLALGAILPPADQAGQPDLIKMYLQSGGQRLMSLEKPYYSYLPVQNISLVKLFILMVEGI